MKREIVLLILLGVSYASNAIASEPEVVSVNSAGELVPLPFLLGRENRLSANGRTATFSDAQGRYFARIRLPAPATTVPIAKNYLSGEPVDGTYQVRLSDQGRYAVFTSTHCDLTEAYQCGSSTDFILAANIYRTDLESGVTDIVSTTINDESGTNAGDTLDHSINPMISADGRWIAFESFSNVLIDVPSNPTCRDVYLRDMAPGGFTRLLTRYGHGETSCAAGVGGDSYLADMTPDGRHIVLVSNAPQLTGEDVNSPDFPAYHLFVYTGPDETHFNGQLVDTGIRVVNPVGPYGEYTYRPTISDDGNIIAFVDKDGPFSAPHPGGHAVNSIAVYNRQANKIIYLGGNGEFPLVSGNGEFVVFQSTQNFDIYFQDLNGTSDIFVWRPIINCSSYQCLADPSDPSSFYLVSRSATTSGNGASRLFPFVESGISLGFGIFTGGLVIANDRPGTMISGDGRYVAFNSDASDLVAADSNGFPDVFVRDRQAEETRVASVPLSGEHVPGLGAGNVEIDALGTLALFQELNPDPALPPLPYLIYTLLHDMRRPAEVIAELKQSIIELNLRNGVSNSLDGKLIAVDQALSDARINNDAAAIAALEAFIKHVDAQRGINLTNEEADNLIAAAQTIIDLI